MRADDLIHPTDPFGRRLREMVEGYTLSSRAMARWVQPLDKYASIVHRCGNVRRQLMTSTMRRIFVMFANASVRQPSGTFQLRRKSRLLFFTNMR